MTASERLRELGWDGREGDTVCSTCACNKRLHFAAFDALPLIADVVEANEAMVGYTRLVLDSYVARPELEAALRKSSAALTALRDALEPRVISAEVGDEKIIYSDASGKPFDPQPVRDALEEK